MRGRGKGSRGGGWDPTPPGLKRGSSFMMIEGNSYDGGQDRTLPEEGKY